LLICVSPVSAEGEVGLDLRLDDMAPIAGFADEPDANPSAIRSLWAGVLLLALYDAIDSAPSHQRDEARQYLTTRSADLRSNLSLCWLREIKKSHRAGIFCPHLRSIGLSGWDGR
jgi:hypothetical protein